jgi:hypothetical protein
MEEIRNRHSIYNFDNLADGIYSPVIFEEPKRKIYSKILIQPIGKYIDNHPELYTKIPPMFFDETPKIDYSA